MTAPAPVANTEIVQLDIGSPLIAAAEEWGQTLVRLWGRPLGFISVPAGTTAEQVAMLVWRHLRPAIDRALADGELPSIRELPVAGLRGEPSWKQERERACRSGTPLAVVVCTRNRSLALARALGSMSLVGYHDLEIIVVDNDSKDTATREVFELSAANSPHAMRYVDEPRAGLSWARNAGLAATDRQLVAFTDDDVVVDSNWASEIVRAFECAPGAGCVTGQILPFEFRSDASRWREAYAGATKFGFERRVFGRRTGGTSSLYPFSTGECGSGTNMAFRAEAIRAIGGFDTGLGAGTPSRGGEDLAAFFGVLQGGYALVYDPSILVSHAHRHTYADLELQMKGWGSGLTAYLTHVVVKNPRLIWPVLRRAGIGIAAAVSPLSGKNGRKPADYPASLTRAEVAAMPSGPWRYLRGRLRAWASGKAT